MFILQKMKTFLFPHLCMWRSNSSVYRGGNVYFRSAFTLPCSGSNFYFRIIYIFFIFTQYKIRNKAEVMYQYAYDMEYMRICKHGTF